MKDKKETAQEAPVQEQLVKDIVKKELKPFKVIQIVIGILIIFSIVLQLIAFIG